MVKLLKTGGSRWWHNYLNSKDWQMGFPAQKVLEWQLVFFVAQWDLLIPSTQRARICDKLAG